MIFHQHQAIFFHIPKTAGYAMEQYFSPVERDYRVFHEDCLFGLKDGLMTQHMPYRTMLKWVPQETMDAYFKFAFVRNPWDRMLSAYFYLKRLYDEKHGGFEPWLEVVCEQVKQGKYQPGSHYAPQMDYLWDEGRPVLDFIGRYENIQADFQTVCEKLNLPFSPLPVLNKSGLKTGHYSTHYTPKGIDLVAEAYSQEIDFLGYQFESNTPD